MTGNWRSADLKVVGDDSAYWTVAEAAALLGPPTLTSVQVRQLIRLCSIEPVGKRRAGPRSLGRWPAVYDALDLIKAYHMLHGVTACE
jgi:hypothetical protein